MKYFVKPVFEIVHFNSGVIATSGCPCYCDFDDFCLAMENILVADNYYLYSTVDKIKVESDVDILSALLDSCDDKIFLDNQSNSTFYIRKIISNTKNQELIDKMNNKFNPRLIKNKIKY